MLFQQRHLHIKDIKTILFKPNKKIKAKSYKNSLKKMILKTMNSSKNVSNMCELELVIGKVFNFLNNKFNLKNNLS